MNPILWFFVNRPGLLAGLFPFLLLFCFWGVSHCFQRRLLAKRQAEQEALLQAEEPPLPLPNSPPYYHLSDEPEMQLSSEHSGGLLFKVHAWAVDYLVTHFAVLSVLGAVAFGGVAVTSVLSRMRFPNIWAILFGILLFLGYLVFIGVTISLANIFSATILRRLGKHEQ